MQILLTGLCTLHWGRIEYGNIGNYYIVVPLFRKLHEIFPEADIVTTMQMTDEFAKRENIKVLPLDLYYGWRDGLCDTKSAIEEYGIAKLYNKTNQFYTTTPYIEEVLKSDLIIDFSGDMWGDNSEKMGENRYLVDLLKIRTAQLLGKRTVMFASSPGPVTDSSIVGFAKEVYKNFDLVINREGFSIDILKKEGFDVSNTKSYACPAWLFDKTYYPETVNASTIIKKEHFSDRKKNIGMILATYSLPGSSFDAWERDDEDFRDFVSLVEHIVKDRNERVILISHSNGFELPPNFKRTHWRDYKMISKLYEIIESRGNVNMSDVRKVDSIYQPWEMHTLIGNLDMLISGRVHGAVAGLEQGIPTIAFDYKNGPLAHKMSGFFSVIGMEEYVISRDENDFITYFDKAYDELDCIKSRLRDNFPNVERKVEESFLLLQRLMEGTET